MKSISRSSLIAINALSNYIRFGLAIACTFLLTPALVGGLGPNSYGLWTLLLCGVGYLELLDLGLTTGVMKFVSSTNGSDLEQKNRLVNSLLLAACCLSLLVCLIGAAVAYLIGNGYPQEPWLPVLILMLTARVMLGIPLGIFMGALFGEMHIWLINAIRCFSVVLYSIGAFGILRMGYGIVALTTLYAIVFSAESLGFLIAAKNCLGWLRFKPRYVDLNIIKQAAGFCLSSFTSNAANVVLARTDPFIVSAFLSLQAVALYAVPMRIAEQLFQLSKQFINVFSPVLAQLHGCDKYEQVRIVYMSCTKLSWGMMVAIVTPAMLYSTAGLVFWIGPDFGVAGPILVIMLATAQLRVLQESAGSALAMTGRHQMVAKLALASTVSNVLLSIVLVQFWGIYGVAIATLLSVGVLGSFCSTWLTIQHLRISAAQFVARVILPSLVPLICQVACLSCLYRWNPSPGLLSLFAFSSISGLVYLATYARFSLSRNEQQALQRRLIGFRRTWPSLLVANLKKNLLPK